MRLLLEYRTINQIGDRFVNLVRVRRLLSPIENQPPKMGETAANTPLRERRQTGKSVFGCEPEEPLTPTESGLHSLSQTLLTITCPIPFTGLLALRRPISIGFSSRLRGIFEFLDVRLPIHHPVWIHYNVRLHHHYWAE